MKVLTINKIALALGILFLTLIIAVLSVQAQQNIIGSDLIDALQKRFIGAEIRGIEPDHIYSVWKRSDYFDLLTGNSFSGNEPYTDMWTRQHTCISFAVKTKQFVKKY